MSISNRSLKVYEDIKNKIEHGEYSSVTSLREQELSTQYGVSRNTIKKVLLMLERDKLVEIEQNKSAKIRSYSKKEVKDFLELRSVLEGFVAHLSAKHIKEEQLQKLEEVLSIMSDYIKQGDLISYSQNNQVFHNIIYEACPNIAAVNQLISLKLQMSKYNTRTILVPGRSDLSFSEHYAIFEALKKHDGDLADILMRKHIDNVCKAFMDNYELLS